MGFLDRILRSAAPDQPIIAKQEIAERTLGEPLEGTNMSLWQSQIPFFWQQNNLGQFSNIWWPADGRLAERVWVANRCMQLNAQQIASMPLEFTGSTIPEWVSSPDPNWYPNGISDALFSIVHQLYGWGFSCLYVTTYYADGYPRNWTVLPSDHVSVTRGESGAREYKLGEVDLDPERIVQIDRDPGWAPHGCSALRAYAQQAWGLLAAGNTSMSVSEGGFPKVYLKSERRLTEEQAGLLQAEWMNKAQQRNGAPPVLPPEITPTELAFNPSDLALLDTQKWNAEIICTAFGLPSVLLNMALQGGLTYQNPAALGEMWWRFELRPTAKRIADALTAQMLPAGQYVEFDASDTFLPLSNANAGPFASDEDDDQAETNQQPATADASPGPRVVAIGGN